MTHKAAWLVSYHLLTNNRRLDWLASVGHVTMKPQNFHENNNANMSQMMEN